MAPLLLRRISWMDKYQKIEKLGEGKLIRAPFRDN